ncbi:MAG: hypothetical protein IMY75_01580 [Chloroflexi bacterium]|nr:hypothetical protein [Chloroflexota bacterium]
MPTENYENLRFCGTIINTLVGIGAIVLNGAIVGREALVGAGALVPEGMVIPPRHLALGTPARIVRRLTDEEIERLHTFAVHYVARAQAFLASSRGG